MAEHGSRRRQVYELFSGPEGSSELWNEIELSERRFNSSDWCNLAFDAAHNGHLSLLIWLIDSKKVPFLIRNRKGCNLLHAAASFGQESVAEWLLNRNNCRFSLLIFCCQSNRKRTPLEVAVCSNRYGMVSCLLDSESINAGSNPQVFNLIRHCCRFAEPAMEEYLVDRLQTMEVTTFFFDLAVRSEQRIDEVLPKLAEFSWWGKHRDIKWNEHAKFAFYMTLQAAAKSCNKELIMWLLNEWKVSLKPPSTYDWKGLSITDVVAMGEDVDEGILKDMGDSDDDRFSHHTKQYFDMVVACRWEDGQCSSLVATLEPLIYKEGETHYLKNKWFEALCQRDFERRLEVLEIFAQNYEDPGAESFALPRLDLVVACGQVHILKWLIDSGFVNLSPPISSSEEMDACKDEDDSESDVDDADCAICYRIKRFPVELQCGHSYCLSCIRQVHTYSHANMQSFQCPYCRRHLIVPPSMTIISKFLHHLKSDLPWLRYRPSNTLGEILLALAAGTGSVFILEYLTTQHGINPSSTLYDNARNLMHVAASRPNLISCKWLCLNGYRELASRLSDENLSPVHEVINNSNHAASSVFDLFHCHGVLPHNWIDMSVMSPNAGMVQTVQWSISRECTDAISKLLAVNAPFDQLVRVIKKSTSGKCDIFDDDAINSQFELIIQCCRVDVLTWLYNSNMRRQFTYFRKEHRQFIRSKIGECNSDRSAIMEAFLNDVEMAEKLRREINACCLGFNQMVLNGAPVVEIENIIDRQQELIKHTQTMVLKPFYSQISFDDIVEHALNPLETAAYHGHLHLIDWILKMPITEMTKGLSQVFEQAIIKGSTVVFKFTLSWLKENNQPLPTSIHIFDSDYSLLHAVVSVFVTTCSFMGSDAEHQSCTVYLEMAQMLVDQPDVNVNALNEKCETALFYLARVAHFSRKKGIASEKAELISDCALKLIQMLVNAGTDLHHLNANNSTFFEVVLEEGSPLLMKAIRWLALEKGIDIQFAHFDCFVLDRNIREQAAAEFNAIREEQRLLRAQHR